MLVSTKIVNTIAVIGLLSTSSCAVSTAQAHLSSWAPFGDSGYTLDTGVRHSANPSLRCDLKDANAVGGASTTVTLNQIDAAPIVVTGWSKAQDVSGTADGEYSIYVDLTYMDGTPLWGSIVSFDAGTHDWQQRRLTIAPSKPVKSLVVYALFRHHTGTAWFDGFEARQLNSSRQFDGQDITPPSTVTANGGWFVRNLSAGSVEVQPIARSAEVALSTTPNSLSFREGQGVGPDIVRARLVNKTHAVQCVTVYYIEKYAPKTAVWWDDIRSKRSIMSSAEYGNLTGVSVGANGVMSLYPYGCVSGNTSARVLGVPADLGPRITRIGYNGGRHLYYVAFDVALTPAGDPRGHDHADLGVVRYNVDPHWGFRAATDGYYRRFPAAFARRSKVDGIWMPFTDPSTVPNCKDFHFAYHEGDNSVASDRSRSILSFRYIEPMTYWMRMDASTARTYDNAVAILKTHASAADSTETRAAKAVLSSGSLDSAGHYNLQFQNTPWTNGAVWLLNPNPSIQHAPADWTTARINALAEPVAGKSNEPDGVYLDSLESWSDTLDYGQRSLDASTLPLTFTPSSFRPVIPTWFSVYEDTHKLSTDLHKNGRLLMANSTPIKYSAFSPLLDVMGIETNWNVDGNWAPDSDAVFNLRRTVSYHKPYLLLQNTDFGKFSKDDAEKYFKRCAFYGVFPSFFSADAATNAYWETPALYDRDRPLFETYIPVISRRSKAGWEPITDAAVDRSTVWTERYGKGYFTVLNSTESPVKAMLHIDCAKLGLDTHRSIAVVDVLTGQTIDTVKPGPTISVPVDLAGSETRVLSIAAH